ncbi:hypothetical protein N2152v2_003170 [Parachlorella kessleri]
MPPSSAPNFQQEYPLFRALACNNTAEADKLSTPAEVRKCGPGNLSALMLALLLDADQLVPRLLAAGTPVNARLSLDHRDSQLSSWLAAMGLGRSRCRTHLQVGRSALDLALRLDKAVQARALVEAGADLDAVLGSGPCGRDLHNLDPQVADATLAYYTMARLQAASPWLLCQVAQLTLLAGHGGGSCLQILQLAAQRGVAFALEDAEQLLWVAAKGPHRCLEVALWVVQHCPNSVWPLVVKSLYSQFAGEQEDVMVESYKGVSPLQLAGAKGYAQVAMFLARAMVDSVWQLLSPRMWQKLTQCVHPQVAAALFPYLLQQIEEGQLQLAGSEQLTLLLQHVVAHKQPATCLALLQAASQRGLQLSAEEESVVFQWAVKQGLPGLVVQFLEAGASVSLEAILAAVEGLSAPCLAVLLLHKPAPQVDRTSPYCKNLFDPWQYTGHWWTCPILRTLQNNSRQRRDDCCADDEVAIKALCVLELLLDAGYRPATYETITWEGDPKVINPLEDRPAYEFKLTGCNRPRLGSGQVRQLGLGAGASGGELLALLPKHVAVLEAFHFAGASAALAASPLSFGAEREPDPGKER